MTECLKREQSGQRFLFMKNDALAHNLVRLNKGFLNMIAFSIYLDPKREKVFHKFKIERLQIETHFKNQIQRDFLKFTTFGWLRVTNLKLSIKSRDPNLMLLAKALRAALSEKILLYF
jgi:hypothetical protein